MECLASLGPERTCAKGTLATREALCSDCWEWNPGLRDPLWVKPPEEAASSGYHAEGGGYHAWGFGDEEYSEAAFSVLAILEEAEAPPALPDPARNVLAKAALVIPPPPVSASPKRLTEGQGQEPAKGYHAPRVITQEVITQACPRCGSQDYHPNSQGKRTCRACHAKAAKEARARKKAAQG